MKHVIMICILLSMASVAQAQEPNNILLPASEESSYEMEINQDEGYRISSVISSDGSETRMEYDRLGNRIRTTRIPPVISPETPIYFQCLGDISYNQPSYIYENTYMHLSEIPEHCPSPESPTVVIENEIPASEVLPISLEQKSSNTDTHHTDEVAEEDAPKVSAEDMPSQEPVREITDEEKQPSQSSEEALTQKLGARIINFFMRIVQSIFN